MGIKEETNVNKAILLIPIIGGIIYGIIKLKNKKYNTCEISLFGKKIKLGKDMNWKEFKKWKNQYKYY